MDNLPPQERQLFVASVYDRKNEKFNTDVIHQAEAMIKKNMAQRSQEQIGNGPKKLNPVKRRILTKEKDGFISIISLTVISILCLIAIFLILNKQ